jgi:hypothetical protein
MEGGEGGAAWPAINSQQCPSVTRGSEGWETEEKLRGLKEGVKVGRVPVLLLIAPTEGWARWMRRNGRRPRL